MGLGKARRIARRLDDSENGVVLITVSVILVALLAAGALALDLGSTLIERREARNAADHAALAAAWANCNGGTTPNAAANASVARNGFETSNLSLTETETDVFEAVVTSDVAMNFSGVIGIDAVEVSGSAVATCATGGGSANAIFAGGECSGFGKPTLEVNGSKQTVYGGIHSNDNVEVPGSDNDFGPGSPSEDAFTYSGNGKAFDDGGGGNGYDPGYPAKIPIQPWPVLYELSDYAPGSAYATSLGSDYHYYSGDLKGEDILNDGDGLYYAKGLVDIDKEITGKVTIVSESEIKIGASDQDLEPFVDNLLFYSGLVYSGVEACDKFVVTMSGSNQSWSGIVYGPGGLVEFPGSSNTTLNGSLIGNAVRLNGSEITIISDPSLFAGEDVLKLLE